MTVGSNPRRAGPFLGNGVTTSFPFEFKVFSAEDVQVTLATSIGEEVLSSGFSVTLNEDQDNDPGGTVVYPLDDDPLPDGDTLTVTSALPVRQATDITNLGRFLPQVHENVFDYLTILVQQQQEQLGRQLVFPVSDADAPVALTPAAQRLGKLLGFNATSGRPEMSDFTMSQVANAIAAAYVPGTTMDALSFLQSGTGAVARTAQAKARDIVSVKDFGAVGDGVTDDTLAIQKAVDAVNAAGGGGVYFPRTSTYYRVQTPIYLRSGVVCFGDGEGSFVYNDRAASVTFGDQMVFLPGAFDNVAYNALTYNACSNIAAGDLTLTLTTPADSARYPVGTSIIIRDTASVAPASTNASVFMRFNKVTAVDAGTGALTLEYPIDTAVAGVSVSPTDEQTNFYNLAGFTRQKCFVAWNAGLRNLKIKSNGFWTGATAAVGCTFENLSIESTALIYGNSFQRCQWRGIRGKFKRIVAEIASNSFNTIVDGVVADRITGDATAANILTVNEGSEAVRIQNVHCNLDTANFFTQIISAFQTKDCSVRFSSFRCAKWRGTLIAVNITSGLCDGFVAEGNTFYATSQAAYGIDLIGPTFVKNAKILNNRFYGASFTGGAGRLTATDNEISGNVFEATNAFQIASTAVRNRIERNVVPGGFSASSGILQVLAMANTMRANSSTRGDNIQAGAYFLPGAISTSSTVPNNVVASSTFTAPSFSSTPTKRLRVRAAGVVTGVAGQKDVAIVFAGATIGTMSLAAGEQGRFQIDVDLRPTQVGGSYFQRQDRLGVYSSDRGSIGVVNFLTTNYTMELRAFVQNAADNITIDDFQVEVVSIT